MKGIQSLELRGDSCDEKNQTDPAERETKEQEGKKLGIPHIAYSTDTRWQFSKRRRAAVTLRFLEEELEGVVEEV
jgi:hypothetical protein